MSPLVFSVFGSFLQDLVKVKTWSLLKASYLQFVHHLDFFLDWLWWKWLYKLLFSSTQSDALLLKSGALQFTWSSCFLINMPTKLCEIIFLIYYSPSSNWELPSVFHIPVNLKGDHDSQQHKMTNLKKTLQNQFGSWVQWQQSNLINTYAPTWTDPNTAQISHQTPPNENI